MSQGRHRKPNDPTTVRKIALGTTVGLGVVVVPATFASSASAADMAKWDCIAQYESNGQWSLPYGDADSTGGLQIQDRTWADFGGLDIAPHAYMATKAQQIAVAEKILASQGPSAWATAGSCSGVGSWDGTATPAPDPAPAPVPDPAPSGSGNTDVGNTDVTYTVKPGDYLVKIAKSLGISDWKTIYNLNKGVIGGNPSLILPGMVLKLPAPANPYTNGLPTPNHSSPSAVALQEVLKAKGYMSSSVVENANYGPKTQAAVAAFHVANPQFSTGGHDVAIGPKGWAFLSGTTAPSTGGGNPAPTPTPSSADWVRPLDYEYRGDGLIVGSGGSMSRSAGGHSGVDLIAPQGRKVVAIADSVVVGINAAGSAYGNHVVIKLPDGKYALYAHLSAISVSVGQSLTVGQQVGNVGATGNASGPHLHFEIRTDPTAFNSGIFLDPISYLASHGVNI